MTRLVDFEERIGTWQRAFDLVRREYTPDEMRKTLAAMTEVEGMTQLQSYLGLARIVTANDRMAALVAALLITTGIRPVALEDLGIDGEG